MERATAHPDAEREFDRLRMLLETQRRVLELVATKPGSGRVLETLCREIEALVPESLCTVMVREVDLLRLVAAPSAPAELRGVLEGLRVGEGVCGRAAEIGEAVLVSDAMADESLRPWRAFLGARGVESLWSVPILSGDGGVLGTFAVYLTRRATPDGVEGQILETGAKLASISMERAAAAASVERAETTYRTVFELANDAIFIHDLVSGAITDVNPRACEMFGYAREEALRLTVGELSAGAGYDDDAAQERIRRAASGRPPVFEWRGRRRDGTTFWVEVSLKRGVIGGEDRVLAVVRDISERKAAEEALRESEATLRSIMASTADYVILTDTEGRIRFVNRIAPEHTMDQVVGSNVFSYVEDRFHPAMRACFERVRATGEPDRYEVEHTSPHFGRRIFESRVAPVVHENETVGFTIAASDVTVRREAERAIAESEERFRQLAEAIDDVFWLTDWARHRVIYVSPAYERIWGRPASQLGADPSDWLWGIHEEDRARVERAWDERAASGRYDVEYRIVRPDGQVRWIRDKAFPIRDAAGGVTRLAGISEDITERKLAERAIVESEERFRQLTEAIDDVFWLTDWEARRVVYVSPSYERVYGRTCESLYRNARSWADAIHPEDVERARGEFYGGAERGAYDTEYRIVRPDGEVRWIHDKAFPIRDASGRVVRMAGVSEDITERKHAEEEIVRRVEAERILRRELDHRVRNNLASLVALIEISHRSATDLESFAGAIKGRVNAMATIHSFLSKTNWSELDLRGMIGALTPLDARATVECEGERVMVPAYQCNSLAVVLHELMHNSIKHGALGRPEGRVRVSWSAATADGDGAHAPDDGVRLSVRWREHGGAPIEAPPTPGVGTALIEGLVKWDLGGDVRFGFPPEGPDHRLDIVLRGPA